MEVTRADGACPPAQRYACAYQYAARCARKRVGGQQVLRRRKQHPAAQRASRARCFGREPRAKPQAEPMRRVRVDKAPSGAGRCGRCGVGARHGVVIVADSRLLGCVPQALGLIFAAQGKVCGE